MGNQQKAAYIEAITSGKHAIDQLIEENGIDYVAYGVGPLTLLMAACMDDNLEAVNYLISKNANVNLIINGAMNHSALSYSMGNNEIMLRLLDEGADPYFIVSEKTQCTFIDWCIEPIQDLINRKMIEINAVKLDDNSEHQSRRLSKRVI